MESAFSLVAIMMSYLPSLGSSESKSPVDRITLIPSEENFLNSSYFSLAKALRGTR